MWWETAGVGVFRDGPYSESIAPVLLKHAEDQVLPVFIAESEKDGPAALEFL